VCSSKLFGSKKGLGMPRFVPRGVCARAINFDVDGDGAVRDVVFEGGCPGNAVGVARLAEGRSASELIEMFDGLPCGNKPTSCPAQLALALSEHLNDR
jgi:uncharacterized protein (TIGR03905 family)